MRSILALVLILLLAPVATARAENDPPEKEPRATISQTVVESEAPAAPEIEVTEVQLPSHEERARADAAATQDMPARGSFWWLVGVIVVAGVILVVLLD